MSLYVPLAKTPQLPKRYVLQRGYSSGHKALDMTGTHGQKVIASQGGQVFAASWEGDPPGASGPWAFGGGWTLLIDHYGLGNRRSKTAYAHMIGFTVRAGQWVQRGQVVGYADTTGNSTGNHVHFAAAEARGNPLLYASYVWTDPRLYMRAHAYMNGSQGHGSLVNSAFFANTFEINPGVNIRSAPSTASKVLATTKVRTPVVFIDDVRGTTWSGSNIWYRVWHPTYTVCYVHGKLGALT